MPVEEEQPPFERSRRSVTRTTGRIAGYDVARGMAIGIMLIINTKGVLCLNDASPLWLSDLIQFMDRRAAAMLVMVSGIGVSLMMGSDAACRRRLTVTRNGRLLMNRSVFLLMCGYLLTGIWSGDILHFYGIFLLTGIVAAFRSDRFILTAAALVWMTGYLQYTEVFDLFYATGPSWHPADLFNDIFFTGYYPFFPWAAFFLAGMVLGRKDFSDVKTVKRYAVAGGVLFLVVESVSWLSGHVLEQVSQVKGGSFGLQDSLFYLLASATEIDLSASTPFSVLSAAGMGLVGIMAGLSVASKTAAASPGYLVTAGRSSLTLYIGHIVVLVTLDRVFNISNVKALIPVLGLMALFFWGYLSIMTRWLARYPAAPIEMAMRGFRIWPDRFDLRRSPSGSRM